MIKLIIFDYDGVIIDSFPIYHQIYKIICEKTKKFWPSDIEEFRKIYGKNSHECWDNLGRNEDEKLVASITIKEELPKHEPNVFEGIAEVLTRIHRKFKLAIISSSLTEEAKRNLLKYNLSKFFDIVIAKELAEVKRFNKTEHIQKVIKDLVLKPEEVVMVGDRNVDFIEGSAAGLKNIILVDYGWGYNLKEIPNYNQKIIIKKPSDLSMLLNLNET